MKPTILASLSLLAAPAVCFGQFGGGVVYSQTGAGSKSSAVQNERSKRVMTREEMPPDVTSTLLEANVLMNRKADEYTALFGVLEEAPTVVECQQKMEATIAAFTSALSALGIPRQDIFVDFIAQNKVYGYELSDQVAREKLAGFELKKNVAVHFRDYALLDKLVVAASQSRIYDLIKVDYVLKDPEGVRSQLTGVAARVLKQKAERYERLMGLRLGPPAQVYADRFSVYYPSEMYDSYTAFESESVNPGFDRQRYIIQGARKGQTFYYNPLTANGFDTVVNPVVIEPMIQCTLYMKARYAPASRAGALGPRLAPTVRARSGKRLP